ncbi:MAG: DUF4169 family protein [Sphingomonadales bacterium]|nr:DUF4169 family protein [Sphingomonadales bacterium]MBD3774871.1 DUF4169 family protein [Paracoccaceae bacterium]
MGEVVNLRLARKAKKRSDKAREAEANRAKFGQSRAEKDARQDELARTDRILDGAKRESD